MTSFEEYIKTAPDDDDKVVKELLDIKKDLIAKSELTFQQVVETCKLKHIARKYQIVELGLFIDDFLQGMISKDRKGRKEFIEALQANRENKQNAGMFSNMSDKLR